jgi:hypothetical protein
MRNPQYICHLQLKTSINDKVLFVGQHSGQIIILDDKVRKPSICKGIAQGVQTLNE